MIHGTGLNLEILFVIIAGGGYLAGKLFRKFRIPSETGKILLGFLLGPSGALILTAIFHHEFTPLISENTNHILTPFSQLALGIMVFNIGSHLTKNSLHNAGKRIINLSIVHSMFTFSAVTIALVLIADMHLIPAAFLGTIAVAVAPGTVISVIQNKRARGPFTKTLLGMVALSSIGTIFLFEFVTAITTEYLVVQTSLFAEIGFHLLMFIAMIGWGYLVGIFASILTKYYHKEGDVVTVIILLIICNTALAPFVALSPLLINLVMAITYANKSFHAKQAVTFFNSLEGILFSLFFVLAGAHLDIRHLPTAGIAGLVFIVVRIAAQWFSAYATAHFFNYSRRIGQYLGLAMIPKAGLAIGLLLSLGSMESLAPYMADITTVVLAAVIVNELIGPFMVAFALKKTEEVGQATPRLIDFLHEEFILMPLEAKTKWDAIETMSEFLVKAHSIKTLTPKELHAIVEKREKEFPTAIGEHIAVPHARIPGNHMLMGAIGICPKPIDFEAYDNKPVDIVILVATPEGKDNLHVKLLGAIAQIFSNRAIHDAIAKAGSSEEVYDILQSNEIRTINEFLDDEI